MQSRAPLLELPAELTPSAEPGVRLAEERRLFYVAMTRARDELWLSYHLGGRGPAPAVAVHRRSRGHADERSAALSIDGPSSVEQIEQGLQAPPVPVIAPRSTGGPLSLSFSQVDEYLTCPERYRLR